MPIEQVELRWTDEGQRGFSAIAYSERYESSLWAARLQPIARPPKIQQSATVVYEVFGGDAVVIFRFLMQPTDLDGSTGEWGSLSAGMPSARDNLVARAIVGPLELITPEIALVLSFLGRPDFINPPPGKVLERDRLPILASAVLEDAVQRVSPRLDELARRDKALESVIATALTEPLCPVNLQLPETEVGTESTTALLWGLWRTTNRVLAVIPDWQWTFSTGEEPSGNTDPGSLPQLIVRRLPRPDDPRPSAQRDQRVVQPRMTYGSIGRSDAAATAAHFLAAAYRTLPIEDFSKRLHNICTARNTLVERLALIPAELSEFRAESPMPAVHSATTAAYFPASGARPSSLAPNRPVLEGAQAPAADAMQDPVAAVNDPREAPKRESVVARGAHRIVGTDTFGHLFGQLTTYEDDSEVALDRIIHKKERGELPTPRDRAALRVTTAREGWFVRQFDYQRRDVYGCVAMLLDLTVQPDLADLACRPDLIKLLQGWVVDARTPAVVILALDELITRENDYELQRRIIPSLGYRWRREHGRYSMLREPTQSLSPEGGTTRGSPWWVPFKREHVRSIWVNIIFVICVAEIIILAVLLVWRR